MDIKEQLKIIRHSSIYERRLLSMHEKRLIIAQFRSGTASYQMIAEGYEKRIMTWRRLYGKEEIRECKILAGNASSQIKTFYPEIADIWVESIRNIRNT